MDVFTVGHSTHGVDEFVVLLATHDVTAVADVRTVPRSARVPHFNAEALPGALAPHGIAYRHLPDLGGLRRPAPGSANTGWDHAGFRGYADHMATEAFERGLAELTALASERRTAVMCAEGLWWRCHRRLLSDALTIRGWTVRHVLPSAKAESHRITEFAAVDGQTITYPPAQVAFDL